MLQKSWLFLFFVLIGLLIFFQYCLWFNPGGIQDWRRIKRQLTFQIEENQALKKRNSQLLFQVERLNASHEAVESRARSELGMVKKGETFYQIIKARS